LAAIAALEHDHHLFDGGLYVFNNRTYDKIKCWMGKDNGFALYSKASAQENFKWPMPNDEVTSLTGTQIKWLFDGYDLALIRGYSTLHYESVNALKALFSRL
jgi:transposase